MVELGITQKDAAKFLCIAQPTINQKFTGIEGGYHENSNQNSYCHHG
ncbi:hypothetical protein [Eisenbergiella porci]